MNFSYPTRSRSISDSRSFSSILFLIKYVPTFDSLCDRKGYRREGETRAKRGKEREREGLGDMNVSWDIGSTRCSPRFANSLADHDRRHVSVELSKYLARIPLGILIRVIVRQSSIPLFLATPWNLNVSNQKKWPCNQRRAGIIQQGMKAGRDRRNRNKTASWRRANAWRF